MIPTSLDHTLEEYLKLQLAKSKSDRVELWLNTMRLNSYHGEDIGRNDEELLYKLISDSDFPSEKITCFKPKYSDSSTFVSNNYRALLTSASLIAILIALIFYLNISHAEIALPQVENKIEEIAARDGAVAWLSNNSKFAYSESSGSHGIVLEGEGLFATPASELTPFRIISKFGIATIHGAAFVRIANNTLKIQVLSGTTQMQSSDHTAIVAMSGQQLEIIAENNNTIKDFKHHEIPLLYLSEYWKKFNDADFGKSH